MREEVALNGLYPINSKKDSTAGNQVNSDEGNTGLMFLLE